MITKKSNPILLNIIIPGVVNLIIALLTVVIGYFFVIRQINAMKDIENEKRIIAIQSLIFELAYNKRIIEQYKEHSEVGNNLGKTGDSYSWELNSPLFGNYQYLIQSCYTDMKLAYKITAIYSKLQACEVIVKQVHQLIANNIQIKNQLIDGRSLLKDEIVTLNNQLWQIGSEIISSFDEPIRELSAIKDSLEQKK